MMIFISTVNSGAYIDAVWTEIWRKTSPESCIQTIT